MASGAEREPGAMQTSRSPQRTSSPTKVAAKAWVTLPSDMEVVTCLHGFSQHGDSWQELARLVGAPYRWLTPDVTAASLPEATAEVLGLWAREGVERSHLVGYSQGGRVALYLASTEPGRLLTLTVIGAHAGLPEPERAARLEEDLALAERIERRGVDWFAEDWAARPIFGGLARRGPAFLARLDADRRRNDAALLAANLRGLGAGATPPFWDRLGAIQAPTLLLAGAEDPRYVDFAGKLAKAIPHSRPLAVPEAGHAVHLEQPELAARLLRDHLSRR
jgi:2-succinyl-6-hydroxy-2,4-cyclohexadiene-1-carboxylate synthase